mmetsp:Transcript_11522/g.17364  ORF Transcript_11522/g.17364 Transcript_11522/m.17364 type:complete len:98 (-) Transcript_11522:768-1061(-)
MGRCAGNNAQVTKALTGGGGGGGGHAHIGRGKSREHEKERKKSERAREQEGRREYGNSLHTSGVRSYAHFIPQYSTSSCTSHSTFSFADHGILFAQV